MGSHASREPYEREKSVRLTAAQVERLERAAHAAGMRSSELIRDAIERRCDDVLGKSLSSDLAGYVGVLNSSGLSPARQARDVFGDDVMEKHAPARRRTRR